MHNRTLFLLCIIACFMGLLFSACGQKGPLYLPDSADDSNLRSEIVTEKASAKTSETEQKKTKLKKITQEK
ncbi:MAG: lipoprotein [Gammaproteobacteria bacterium]|nr:lipoprotein [Gammaproteobacteria bacterium]